MSWHMAGWGELAYDVIEKVSILFKNICAKYLRNLHRAPDQLYSMIQRFSPTHYIVLQKSALTLPLENVFCNLRRHIVILAHITTVHLNEI